MSLQACALAGCRPQRGSRRLAHLFPGRSAAAREPPRGWGVGAYRVADSDWRAPALHRRVPGGAAERTSRYLRPDVCLTGFSQALKIAALAESWRVGIIPHNWLSPVSTAASVQLDAAIPNFVLQEYRGEDRAAGDRARLVRRPLV